MEVEELLSETSTKVFVDQNMVEGALLGIGPGVAAVYSSRCPGKETPNEDAAVLIPCGDDASVLAVADGVGGARAGMEASSLAVTALKEEVEKGFGGQGSLRSSILDGFEAANQAVLGLGVGAATTLAVVEVQGTSIRPYHVGDSPILVVGQRGKIKLQSISHSPVGYGLEGGFINEKEALHHEERHIVSNVVGIEDMRIDVGSALELAARDTLLIASDGLADNLKTEEIVGYIRKGPLAKAMGALAQRGDSRMREGSGRIPSKPDDLTFILFRLTTGRRKRAPTIPIRGLP
jgi:serine/threonine protein phosphatase PrpC